MIYHKAEARQYKEEFTRKFSNFSEKAPILISYVIEDKGVEVKHENSGTKYFYEWDYEIPVKAFIHRIKQDLSFSHYPRIVRTIRQTIPVDENRAAELLASGIPVDKVPDTEVVEVKKSYRIDKILALQDMFIIIDEDTGEQSSYKMVGTSAIYYLRNYRMGKYQTPEIAGDEFFKSAVLETQLGRR